jgi:hypothetical protein
VKDSAKVSADPLAQILNEIKYTLQKKTLDLLLITMSVALWQ